jgi:hypothetical protein
LIIISFLANGFSDRPGKIFLPMLPQAVRFTSYLYTSGQPNIIRMYHVISIKQIAYKGQSQRNKHVISIKLYERAPIGFRPFLGQNHLYALSLNIVFY